MKHIQLLKTSSPRGPVAAVSRRARVLRATGSLLRATPRNNILVSKISIQKIFFISLFLFPMITFAAVPTWKIVPNESSLTFTGTQNDSPVTGEFKRFSGDIQFDPDQLSASHVHIVVDMNSLSTSYKDLTDTLITPDWFNIKVFPQATFEAKNFTKISNNKYEAKGNLTIRDKTQPVSLQFDVLNHTDNSAEIKGSTILKRTDFGIGQGEWASTKEVKNNVTVNFKIKAIK